LHLSLMPTSSALPPMRAIIKLHYQSNDLSCLKEQLVPILTLTNLDASDNQVTRYKMVRVGGSAENPSAVSGGDEP
jgi:hypothetical protein